jgi:prepilin peptidase CpaA
VSYSRLQLIPLGLCLLLAAAYDLRSRRVPNVLVGVAAVAGLIAQSRAGGVSSIASGGAAAAVAIALLFPFWKRGGLGGGDVKLAGAVALWVGLRSLPTFALGTALAGGVTALTCLLLSKRAVRLEIQANLTLAVLHQRMPGVARSPTRSPSPPAPSRPGSRRRFASREPLVSASPRTISTRRLRWDGEAAEVSHRRSPREPIDRTHRHGK